MNQLTKTEMFNKIYLYPLYCVVSLVGKLFYKERIPRRNILNNQAFDLNNCSSLDVCLIGN